MKITAYIIAYNEVEKIRDCINSVLWADEIILADSYSTDGTTEIAEELGISVNTVKTQLKRGKAKIIEMVTSILILLQMQQ